MWRSLLSGLKRVFTGTPPSISEQLVNKYSQCGDELAILQLLPQVSARPVAVEIGARDGTDLSNTKRLEELGWRRILFDTGSFAGVVQAHVTAENVGQLLAEHGAPLDPGVLSIDIDGNDYWVLKAILALGYRPAILVVEYKPLFGPDQCVVQKYQPAQMWDGTVNHGASALAIKRLLDVYDYQVRSYDNWNIIAVADPPRLPSRICHVETLDPSRFVSV
jgi:hypothetical protein